MLLYTSALLLDFPACVCIGHYHIVCTRGTHTQALSVISQCQCDDRWNYTCDLKTVLLSAAWTLACLVSLWHFITIQNLLISPDAHSWDDVTSVTVKWSESGPIDTLFWVQIKLYFSPDPDQSLPVCVHHVVVFLHCTISPNTNIRLSAAQF